MEFLKTTEWGLMLLDGKLSKCFINIKLVEMKNKMFK